MRGWCLVALGMWVPAAFAGRVDIVSPRDGETLVDNEGKVPITLNLSLAPGERLQLLLNGIVIDLSGPEGSGRVLLLNVDRGQHRPSAGRADRSAQYQQSASTHRSADARKRLASRSAASFGRDTGGRW